MSALYYTLGNCGGLTTVPQHTNSPCPEFEYGGIRHGAWVKNSFVFIDRTNKNEWIAGQLSGDIQILFGLNGSYDGGTTTELPGFGDSETTNGGTTHIATIKDPNYVDNCDHYNAIRDSNEWTFVFVTANFMHFADAPVTVTPKNPIQEDKKSIVVWEATVKWSNPNSPCPVAKPAGIFSRATAVGN